MSFDDFVRAWCQDPRPDFADVGSQERFLRPRQGVGVDRLFRYEEIGTFVHFLEDRLGCEIILPRLNVSPAGATDLTPETEALLRDFAAEVITKGGFTNVSNQAMQIRLEALKLVVDGAQGRLF